MTEYEKWSLIVSILSTAVGLGGLIFIGVQLRQAAIVSRKESHRQAEELSRQRKAATLEMSMSTIEFRDRINHQLPWNDRDPRVVADFLEKVKGDTGAMQAIRSYLNFYDDLAIVVFKNVLDKETFFELSGSRVVSLANNYIPYIQARRDELGDSLLYGNLEELAKQVQTWREQQHMASDRHVGGDSSLQSLNN